MCGAREKTPIVIKYIIILYRRKVFFLFCGGRKKKKRNKTFSSLAIDEIKIIPNHYVHRGLLFILNIIP